MIRPHEIWLLIDPIDMRAGIDSLSQMIQHTLARSPCDGTAFAFRNRRGNRIKLLIWDGTGVWLCQRRLHQGHFTWPNHEDASIRLSAQHWDWLITGIDWPRLSAPPPVHWRV